VCRFLRNKLHSVKAVANRLGVSEQTVRKWLEYDAVPEELKVLVEEQKLTRSVATRLAQTVVDDKRAIALGRKIAEMNAGKDQRERILAAAEELPERPIQVVLRRSEEKKKLKKITFVLPESWSTRLQRAADKLLVDPEDLARDATIEWLKSNRY
jgi:predicted transcriptional regulator